MLMHDHLDKTAVRWLFIPLAFLAVFDLSMNDRSANGRLRQIRVSRRVFRLNRERTERPALMTEYLPSVEESACILHT